jgi:hypothetical protein
MDHIHKTLFSLLLTNGPYAIECCVTMRYNGLPKANTLAYWAHSKVTKKIVVNAAPRGQLEIGPSGLLLWLTKHVL